MVQDQTLVMGLWPQDLPSLICVPLTREGSGSYSSHRGMLVFKR